MGWFDWMYSALASLGMWMDDQGKPVVDTKGNKGFDTQHSFHTATIDSTYKNEIIRRTSGVDDSIGYGNFGWFKKSIGR